MYSGSIKTQMFFISLVGIASQTGAEWLKNLVLRRLVPVEWQAAAQNTIVNKDCQWHGSNFHAICGGFCLFVENRYCTYVIVS